MTCIQSIGIGIMGSDNMLGTSKERVELLKAGVDIKIIEKLYLILNNIKIEQSPSAKINCWEYTDCGREFGGEKSNELGVCPASIEHFADGINNGKNAGRFCWLISGTCNGREVNGTFAKKLLSCKSCGFFKTVKEQEGVHFDCANPNASQVNNHPALVIG